MTEILQLKQCERPLRVLYAIRLLHDETLTLKTSWDLKRALGTSIRKKVTVAARSSNSDEWQVMGICNVPNVEA
jgi:hypothetical protein